MTDIPKLRKMMEDLNNPRSFIRENAIAELMFIQDESVVPALFKMAVRGTDFVKIHFCRFLGAMGTAAAVPPLAVFLLDKSERVVKEAAHALDKIDISKTQEAFVSMLKRRASRFSEFFSIRSLGMGRAREAVPYLINLLSSKASGIREITIEALRQIADPVAIAPLVGLLADKDDDIVYAALLALGEIGDRKTGEYLAGSLKHPNPIVRRAAVWALGRLEYKDATRLFIEMLESDDSEIVRQEIVKRLGKVGSAAVVKPLLVAKALDKAHNVRIYAEWALGEIPDREKGPTLLSLATDDYEAIRGEAVLEIAKTGDAGLFGMISRVLKNDESEYMRLCAAEGLSFIRAPEVAKALKEALKDSEAVRRRAADALFRIAGLETGAIAADMASGALSGDIYVREVGLKMLEKAYFDKEAPADILGRMYDMLPSLGAEMKALVIRCLGKIGDASTASFLNTLTDGKDKQVSSLAEEQLDRLNKRLVGKKRA